MHVLATGKHSALTLLVATSVPAMLDTLGMECSVKVGEKLVDKLYYPYV